MRIKNREDNGKSVPVTRIFRETWKSRAKVIINEGGARSTKSISLCQYVIRKCREKANVKILVLRKTRVSLRLSTYRDFIGLLKEYNIYDETRHNKSDLIYTFETKSFVRFSGMDNISQVKSTGWNIVWLEEANEFTKDDYLFIKTRLSEAGEDNKILMSYNPEICWIQELEEKEGIQFIFSSYKDNPFLEKNYVNMLESLKDEDITYYKIYTLGQRARAGNLIYEPYIMEHFFPNVRNIWFGLDFGFNHPTALIEVGMQGWDSKDIYLTEQIYQSHLTTPELISLMKEKIPEDKRREPIYADSEDPKAIQEIYESGFNIMPAEKGPGSVRQGILFTKRFKFHTLQENVNLNKEAKRYKWKIDKDGNVLDEPVKFRDDCMNAKRYALFSHLKDIIKGDDIERDITFMQGLKGRLSSQSDWGDSEYI